MALTNWQNARQFLDEKITYILNTDLKAEIAEINGSGLGSTNQLQDPQQIVVGINAIALESANNPVDYPAICVYEVASRNDVNDIVCSQDDVITYEIVAAVASDAGNIAWAAKQAKYTALSALTALEKGLPDAPGASGTCVTYRVDPISSAASRTVPIKTGRMYMSAFAVRFDAYTRTNINYAPRLKDPNFVNDPFVESLFDVTTFVSPIDFDTAVEVVNAIIPNGFATGTATTAQVAAATTVDINSITTTYGIAAGSTVTAVNQTSFATETTTVAGDSVSLTIATLGISDLDEWIVTVRDSTTNVVIFFGITWDIT
jgi:hypothetical protein